MKRTLSIMTMGLLVATSMAFAGEALNQTDSEMLFGEKENSAVTLEKNEMKITEGQYWYTSYYSYPYYDDSYSDDDYSYISQTLLVGDSSAGSSVNAIAGLIPVLSTTSVASSSIVGGNISVDQ